MLHSPINHIWPQSCIYLCVDLAVWLPMFLAACIRTASHCPLTPLSSSHAQVCESIMGVTIFGNHSFHPCTFRHCSCPVSSPPNCTKILDPDPESADVTHTNNYMHHKWVHKHSQNAHVHSITPKCLSVCLATCSVTFTTKHPFNLHTYQIIDAIMSCMQSTHTSMHG